MQDGTSIVIPRALARLGGVVVLAALLLGAGFAFASTAHSQEAKLHVFGPAVDAEAKIGVLVDGVACKNAEVNVESKSPTGYLWSAEIKEGECGASIDSLISFTLGGEIVDKPDTIIKWKAGGDIEVVLTAGDAPTTTPTPENPIATTPAPENPIATPAAAGAPTPPESGNAGLAGGGSPISWLVLGLGALAVATLAGARSVTGRNH